MKILENFVMPFLLKHPTLLVILAMMTIVGLWGYYDVLAEVEAKTNEVQQDLHEIKGELKGMAQYFIGKETFNGHDEKVVTLPPQEYLIGIDTEILKHKFDSCQPGVVIDTTTGRKPWYCWCDGEVHIFK